MCKFKSCLILKDRVYVPDHDIHEIMLEELNIKDTFENAASIFVRAEILPEDGDIFSDVTGWTMHVDQDILPDWYVPEIDESRAKSDVAEWIENHTISEGEQEVRDGTWIAHGSATVRAYGRAKVAAYDSTTVKAYDSAEVTANDSATVKACDSAEVTANDSATVRAFDSAMVEARGSAKVTAHHKATVTARESAEVIAYERVTVEAFERATVTAYGNAEVKVYESVTVEAKERATVTALGRAKVNAHGRAEVEVYERAEATVCDRAMAIIPINSSNNMDNIDVHNDAIAIDHNTNTIKANKKWRMKE